MEAASVLIDDFFIVTSISMNKNAINGKIEGDFPVNDKIPLSMGDGKRATIHITGGTTILFSVSFYNLPDSYIRGNIASITNTQRILYGRPTNVYSISIRIKECPQKISLIGQMLTLKFDADFSKEAATCFDVLYKAFKKGENAANHAHLEQKVETLRLRLHC